MELRARSRLRCRASTALCCTLASLIAVSAAPAQAADECGPVPLGGGTVECPAADYPGGVSYDAGVEDLTVVVDALSSVENGLALSGDANLTATLSGVSISSIDDFDPAISLNSAGGDVVLDLSSSEASGFLASSITTDGDGSAGIYARTATGKISIYGATAITSGDGSAGIETISTSGNQDIAADFIATKGEGSTGILAGSKSGDIEAFVLGVDTSGPNSDGVEISTASGDIFFQSGQDVIFTYVHTAGDYSNAVDLSTVSGDIASYTHEVATHGERSDGIHVTSTQGSVAIHNGFGKHSGVVTTYGELSDGIHVEAGSGPVAIYSDIVRTFGNGSDAIDVTSAEGSAIVLSNVVQTFGGGRGIAVQALDNVSIYSGTVATSGKFGTGIDAHSQYGDILIEGGRVSTSGDDAFGIFARSVLGGVSVTADEVQTYGFYSNGIVAQGWKDVDVEAGSVSTHSPSFGAYGIIANANGSASVTVNQVDVYGLNSYGVVAVGGQDATIHAGQVLALRNDSYGLDPGAGGLVAVAYGGHASIVADAVYAEGLGIYANGYQGVAIEANKVVIAHDESAGIAAQSLGGDVHINVDSVSASGYYAEGIVGAARSGEIDIVADTVHTYGDAGAGILTFSLDADANVTVNKIIAEGYGDIGGLLQSDTGDINVTFNELETNGIGSFGLSAVSREGGNVVITGDQAHTLDLGSSAVIAEAFGGTATINVNSAQVDGSYSAALIAYSAKLPDIYTGEVAYGDIHVTADSVITKGDYDRGIWTHANAADTFIDVGTIEEDGNYSVGIFGFSSFIGIDPVFGSHYYGDISVHADHIIINGKGSAGAFMYNQGGTADGSAAHISGDFGEIDINGDQGTGVFVDAPFLLAGLPPPIDVDISAGEIHMSGADDVGLLVYAGVGDVHVNVDSLEGNGHDSSGAIVVGRNGANLNVNVGTVDLKDPGGEVAYFSPGIYAVTSGGNVVVTAGSVHTEGTYSDGIIASSNGQTDYFGGLHVGSVSIDAGSVSTAGQNAIGIAGTSSGGAVTIHAGTVETHGDYSIGVAANEFAFVAGYGAPEHPLHNGDMTVVADKVTTSGHYSDAVSALNFSGSDTHVDVGTVLTSGDDSYGVNVVTSGQANYYTGQFYGGSTTVTVDKATTTGANATGVRVFAFTGDVDLTVGAVSTTGKDSDAVQALNGSDGTATLHITGDVNSKQGFGAVASAYDDAHVIIDKGASVYGGTVGVYASAFHDGAVATIDNHGDIVSPDIAIMGNYQSVVVHNDGTVTGQVQLAAGDDSFDNEGDWTTFGTSKFGDGSDSLSNNGRVFALGGTASGIVRVSGLESFDNHGLVSLADGMAGQTLQLQQTAFNGSSGLSTSALGSGASSTLALDIGSKDGKLIADRLVIGAASGKTEVEIHGVAALGSAIVVDASSATGEGNFVLASGATDTAFIRLGLDYDSAKADWSVIGTPDSELFETTVIQSTAQSLWRAASDGWADRVRDNRDIQRNGLSLWGRYVGGHERIASHRSFNVLGSSFSPDLGTTSNSSGFLLGADYQHGRWSWGVMGGTTRNHAQFRADGNHIKVHGTTLGAYTVFRSGPFFADALAESQNIRGSADLATAGFKAPVHGHLFGLRGDAGVSLPLKSLIVQPEIGLDWSSGSLDDLVGGAAKVDFRKFTSARVRAGARFSGVLNAGKTTIMPYAGLYAVDEFAGHRDLEFTIAGTTLNLDDKLRPGFAEGTAGAVVDLGRGFRFSVGGQADFLGGHHAWKGQIGLSWHG